MNKKKIFLPIATGLFVAVTLFNVNLLKSNNPGDLLLDALAVMAEAQSELPESGGDWRYVWVVIEENFKYPNDKNKTGVELSCTKVLNPPKWASGCGSEGSMRYLGCF